MPHGSDLASLTLKDLRQLAGEHQIKNRSRLTKQQLIDALGPVVGSQPAPAAAEPEVLDPASIAALTGKRDQRERSDEEPTDDEHRGKDEQRNEDGDVGDDGEPRKKKRRRRRRRKKKSGDAEGSDDHNDDGDSDESSDDEPAAKDERRPAAKEDPRPVDEASRSDQDDADRRKSEGKRRSKDQDAGKVPDERAKSEPRDERAKSEPKDDRPPRPSLESGAKRKLPPVLERMRSFTEGILELCDPDTPSWAQARLSELLAGAGVVPTPCSGRPHPDFHNVIGTVATKEVPAGHIAVIEAPGFSLRGDRGDLFALRAASVRVAGDATRDGDDSDRTRRSSAPREDASPAKEPVALEESSTEVEAAPPPPRPDRERPRDQTPSSPDTSEDDAQEEQRPPRRRRSRRDRDEAVVDDAPSEGPVIDEPEPAAPPRSTKVVKAEEAPALPLVPQEAEELAQRPKAEGWRPLGLNEQILADLHDVGFTEPSEIQAKAVGIVTAGKDLIGQSQTGSGKTAAFVLPLLHRLYEMEGQGPAALILCPTRELARQVHAEFVRMAGKSGARAALIYGGVGMDDQFKALARHPHVVIGTPGRVIDHARRRTLELSRLQMCILDEADQMLDIGFLPDIEWVLRHSPPQRQMLLFSATMPDAIRKLAEQHMHDPELIHVAPKQVTVDEVDQKYIAVDRDKKTALLAHFIETYQPPQMVVFCNTKHQTDRVATVLKKKKMSAAAIHGDLPQAKREKVLQGFRDGSLTCLLATNVAARGLDIPSVSHVVNYDVPGNPEEYVHRVGRTARMGKKGVARTFVTPEDGQFVLEIEKHIGLLLDEEVVEGMQPTTPKKAERSIANSQTKGPRLLKPIMGGIRLGRARR